MSENAPDDPIYCRRLKRVLPVDQHAQCPYCFAKEDAIASGDHERFCDFDEECDAVAFGFPDGGGHFDKA